MPNDINELDVTDAGLKSIFGDRFHDETAEKVTEKDVEEAIARAHEKAYGHKKMEQKPTQKPVEALWEPVKPEPNWLDKLKSCAMWAGGFGGLTMLFFSWQQAGLMDETVALPTMLACAVLAGWGCGKSVTR